MGEFRGSIQPQLLACSTPKTISPRPSAEHRADPIQARRSLVALRLGQEAEREQNRDHEHDLSREHEPPSEVRRHPATEDRADRDPGAGDRARRRRSYRRGRSSCRR